MSFLRQRTLILPTVIVLALVFFFGFWFGGGFTGLTVYGPVVVSKNVDLSFTSPKVAFIPLESSPLSLGVSGRLHGSGRVFLVSGTRSPMVLDSSKLKPEQPSLNEEGLLVLALVNGSGGSDFFSTDLEYTLSDFERGFSKPDGFAGLSVSKTKVPAGGSLCTLWEVYSVDRAASNRFCFGDKNCCLFDGFEPFSDNWNDSLYLYLGSHGASASTVVSAQVMSSRFDLSSTDGGINYGGWRSLPVFFQDPSYRFSDVCIDTCSLEDVDGNISLFVDLKPNSNLTLDSVEYGFLRGLVMKGPPLEFSERNISIWFVNRRGNPVGFYSLNQSGWSVDFYYNSLPYGAVGSGETLLIQGFSNVPDSLGVRLLDDSKVSGRFFAFNDSFEFDEINFSLTLSKPSNVLLECSVFNFNNLSCSEWVEVNATLEVVDGVASFGMSELGVYALGFREPVLDVYGDVAGSKEESDPSFDTSFSFVGVEGGSFVLRFSHNSTQNQPIWVEGISEYNLSTTLAKPFEEAVLVIPIVNDTVPEFKLHVGSQSEVFKFGGVVKPKPLVKRTLRDLSSQLKLDVPEVRKSGNVSKRS